MWSYDVAPTLHIVAHWDALSDHPVALRWASDGSVIAELASDGRSRVADPVAGTESAIVRLADGSLVRREPQPGEDRKSVV